MKNQIIKHLKGKYPTETICKVFDYLHSLANKGDLLPQGTKSTLCSAGQAKLFNDYIDKTPGESLRQLKELQQEIRRDHAIVLNGIYTEELGLVSAKLSSIEKEIAALAEAQDERIDDLEIAVRDGAKAPYRPHSMGGDPVTEALKADAEEKQRKHRCLW